MEKTLSERGRVDRAAREVVGTHFIRQLPLEVLHGSRARDQRLGHQQSHVEDVREEVGVSGFRGRDRGEERKKKREKQNRTLAVLNNREGEDDADTRLPSAVEEEFTPKLYENQSTEDPNWVKPINVYVPPRAKTDTKRIGT